MQSSAYNKCIFTMGLAILYRPPPKTPSTYFISSFSAIRHIERRRGRQVEIVMSTFVEICARVEPNWMKFNILSCKIVVYFRSFPMLMVLHNPQCTLHIAIQAAQNLHVFAMKWANFDFWFTPTQWKCASLQPSIYQKQSQFHVFISHSQTLIKSFAKFCSSWSGTCAVFARHPYRKRKPLEFCIFR